MTTTRPVLTTIQDAYTSWLEAEHPSKPSLKNQDRSAPDRLNYQRALRCFALAASGGVDNLELVPVTGFDIGRLLLGQHVEQGARLLAARSGKAVPSEKTIKNLIACCRAVQAFALDHKPEQARGSSLRSQKAKGPKPKKRPAFPRDAWPESLKAEWQRFETWKMQPVLSAAEGAHLRKKVNRAISAKSWGRSLNAYVGYLVREQHLTDLRLLDLCNEPRYSAYLNWHLSLDVPGGYVAAKNVGIALALVTRYLVATGQLAEHLPTGQQAWQPFYALGNKALEIGAERGELVESRDIGPWRPEHLIEIAELAWSSTPPRRCRTSEAQYDQRILVRQRSALFFRLAHETPMRARNFVEMRWGKNLKRTANGLWEVRFEGQELKVGRRGARTNVYRRTYSREVSRWIDLWRDELSARVGKDFEARCPYVFVRHEMDGKPVGSNAFSANLKELVAELKGWSFHPHKVRHIVASYLVNEHGPGGLGLAAELLGDTVQVVLASYYKPNNEEAMQTYLQTSVR